MNDFFPTLIKAIYRQTGNQECRLTRTREQGFPGKTLIGWENLEICPKTYAGTSLLFRNFPDGLQTRFIGKGCEWGIWSALARIVKFTRFTTPETHLPGLPTTINLDIHSGRKSVDNRRANTMKAT